MASRALDVAIAVSVTSGSPRATVAMLSATSAVLSSEALSGRRTKIE